MVAGRLDQDHQPDEDDTEALGTALKALSFPGRLDLLSELRKPKTVDEIHLTPSQQRPNENPDRQLTRQAIRHHLGKLQEANLVRTQSRTGQDGRTRQAFVLDEAQLYAVVERLRSLASKGTEVPLDPFETTSLENPSIFEEWGEGPKLVLVHGAQKRRLHPLRREDLEGPRGWVIGRAPDAEVSLHYDPYVSAQNAEILPCDNGFEIVDLRTSMNGALVNGRSIPPGEAVDLSHGDIIQVGTSILVFHER